MFTDHDLRIMELKKENEALKIEIAGKEAVIKAMEDDIQYYKKDWRDTLIQDQGLDDE